ncbi:sugar porter family MFS transporter [Catenovulum sp. SX2]|uniref:sugar porter family MFS transporter n=1 Tax=Catenovulum sp. SX2 TaxID=3398614 RepID=UPI003F83F0BB
MNSTQTYAIFVASIAALGGFVFGFDASVISGVIGYASQEFNLSPWQEGFVVSSPTLGAAIASLLAGPIADKVGRKKVLIVIAALYLCSAIASAMANSYQSLIIARIIGGFAFSSLVIAPIYIAEIAPAQLRGKLVSINQLNIVFGFSAAYFANYYLLNAASNVEHWLQAYQLEQNVWRFMLAVEIVPALGYFLLLFLIPESPRWLVLANKTQQAQITLNKLLPAAEALEQINSIRHSVAQQSLNLAEKLKQFFSQKMRLIIIIAFTIGIIQQITGVNAIYFYAPSIFEQSGVGKNAAFVQAIWIGLTNVVFTLIAMVLIDKIGRRPLFIAGLCGVILSMSLNSFAFYQADYKLTQASAIELSTQIAEPKLMTLAEQEFQSDIAFKQALHSVLTAEQFKQYQSDILKQATHINAPLVLFAILFFVASFAVSLGPVMWVLLSEIFPNHLRGLAISIVGLTNSAASFITQLMFPYELATFGAPFTFIVYAVFAALGLVLIYKLLPETKGKTLEELESVLK